MRISARPELHQIARADRIIRAPSPLNWLCSLAFPNKRVDGTWCSPENWAQPILVAHLTNSTSKLANGDGKTTYYDLYRQTGLTA
jgi:hypothetical protein